MNQEPSPTFYAALPLCPLHQSLEDRGELEVVYGNLCIACSLNERVELLQALAPHVPLEGWVDSVGFLRLKLKQLSTLSDERDALHAAGRKVLASMNFHIQAASDWGERVPVFEGIAELHEVLNGTNKSRSLYYVSTSGMSQHVAEESDTMRRGGLVTALCGVSVSVDGFSVVNPNEENSPVCPECRART